ncbi:MAG: hypothetical protein N3B10_10600 [Armatimonadetes bacterium]|nr:hypothetical protein [Armatimonadota bacterium]
MRLWRWLPLALSLLVSATVAFSDPEPSRFIILVPPFSIGSPTTGSIVVIPGTAGFVFPGAIIFSRPIISSRPSVVVPSGYFFVQFQSGNWTVVWCEPLRTNVFIVGRPFIRPIRPTPLVVSPYFFDPSIPYGVPQIWHSPMLQPGVLVFRLKHRSAEEVARLLNEAKVVPDGQFSGMGNILIVSAPSLATSGVQQSRIRDLIAELDKPSSSSSSNPIDRKGVEWQVEVYRAHSVTCTVKENLPSDRAALVKLSGYPCAHKIGETLWNPTAQGDVIVKGSEIDLRLKATKHSTGWRFSLKGQVKGQTVELEGEVPDTSQPILLLAPTAEDKEGVVIAILPKR